MFFLPNHKGEMCIEEKDEERKEPEVKTIEKQGRQELASDIT
jgi:hypothetical protein